MKKYLFIGLILSLLLASCIKSLHSIVGVGDRIIDDRIVGIWKNYGEPYLVHNPNTGTDTTFIDVLQYWRIDRAADLAWEGGPIYENGPENWDAKKVLQHNGYPKPDLKLIKKELHNYYVMHKEFDLLPSEGNYDPDERKMVQLTRIGGNLYMDISNFPSDDDWNHDEGNGNPFWYTKIEGHSFVKIEIEDEKYKLYEFDEEYIGSLIKKKKVRLKHEIVNDEIVLTASTEELRLFLEKYGDDPKLYYEPEEYFVTL